jgi:hypothetical protein
VNTKKTTQEERMRTADRLYRTGLKMREVAERLEPPVTAQRVAQLLAAGVEAGLFTDPRSDRRHGLSLTGQDVRAAASVGSRREVAGRLHVDRAALEAAFGPLLDTIYAQRHAEKLEAHAEATRRITIKEYREVAARLGRNPTSSDLENGALYRRIFKHFGTFESFMGTVGARPDYVSPRWRDREERALNQ